MKGHWRPLEDSMGSWLRVWPAFKLPLCRACRANPSARGSVTHWGWRHSLWSPDVLEALPRPRLQAGDPRKEAPGRNDVWREPRACSLAFAGRSSFPAPDWSWTLRPSAGLEPG